MDQTTAITVAAIAFVGVLVGGPPQAPWPNALR